MNDQAATSKWTAQDKADWQAQQDEEAAWQALQDDANEAYEQSVCNYYASRGQANLY